MKSYPLPTYGRAYCPHCTKEYALESAAPAFLEKAPHNDTLVYLMCPESYIAFDSATTEQRKAMMNACFSNFKLTAANSDGNAPAWSITTTLTLALNGYDYVSAHENGHGLSREEYFSICSRHYEALVLPGGLRMIFSE